MAGLLTIKFILSFLRAYHNNVIKLLQGDERALMILYLEIFIGGLFINYILWVFFVNTKLVRFVSWNKFPLAKRSLKDKKCSCLPLNLDNRYFLLLWVYTLFKFFRCFRLEMNMKNPWKTSGLYALIICSRRINFLKKKLISLRWKILDNWFFLGELKVKKLLTFKKYIWKRLKKTDFTQSCKREIDWMNSAHRIT